jgi:hypothetical protein
MFILPVQCRVAGPINAPSRHGGASSRHWHLGCSGSPAYSTYMGESSYACLQWYAFTATIVSFDRRGWEAQPQRIRGSGLDNSVLLLPIHLSHIRSFMSASFHMSTMWRLSCYRMILISDHVAELNTRIPCISRALS